MMTTNQECRETLRQMMRDFDARLDYLAEIAEGDQHHYYVSHAGHVGRGATPREAALDAILRAGAAGRGEDEDTAARSAIAECERNGYRWTGDAWVCR